MQQLKYHARVESVPLVFQAAAADLQAGGQQAAAGTAGGAAAAGASSRTLGSNGSGSYEVTPDVVAAVWDRLLPGEPMRRLCSNTPTPAAGRALWLPICGLCCARSCAQADTMPVPSVCAAGLLQHYDAPQSLPLIAPRPLLVANGELDPRCPLEVGLVVPCKLY